MKRLALIAALALPAAANAQYYQPAQPYAPPPPPVHYRGGLPSWVPPTLPPGSPSLMIPNPPAPAYPPEALDEPFSAFPSWFLRIECDRCGKVQMVKEAHARWRNRSLRDIIARMRHDARQRA